MKTMVNRVLYILLITAGTSLAGQSQQYPDSLLHYMEVAAKNNPVVRREFTGYKAALQKIFQAGSLSDPQLSIGVFLKPMELIGGNQLAEISLMQMFPWFGVLKNARNEMSLMANAKFELFRDAKLQVYYDVQKTWYDIFKIENEISISEKNAVLLKTISNLALIRFKATPSGGTGGSAQSTGTAAASSMQKTTEVSTGMQTMTNKPESSRNLSSAVSSSSMQSSSMGNASGGNTLADFYRIQIEEGELENNIALLKNQERTKKALLNSYLNRSPISPVFMGEIMIPDSLGLPLEAVYDSIRTKNPMLAMLKFEKESYSARKKMASAMGYPMVGLGLNYSVIGKSEMSSSSMNGNDMIMPMVTITLPIYRKKYKALQAEADLLGSASAENTEAVTNSLNNEYYSAIQAYEDSHRRVLLYKNQLQLASKSFDLLLNDFSTSSASLTEALRVRQQLLDYELKQAEAVADLNTATAWLRRLMASSIVQ
jgi:outer membrane protein TolC